MSGERRAKAEGRDSGETRNRLYRHAAVGRIIDSAADLGWWIGRTGGKENRIGLAWRCFDCWSVLIVAGKTARVRLDGAGGAAGCALDDRQLTVADVPIEQVKHAGLRVVLRTYFARQIKLKRPPTGNAGNTNRRPCRAAVNCVQRWLRTTTAIRRSPKKIGRASRGDTAARLSRIGDHRRHGGKFEPGSRRATARPQPRCDTHRLSCIFFDRLMAIAHVNRRLSLSGSGTPLSYEKPKMDALGP